MPTETIDQTIEPQVAPSGAQTMRAIVQDAYGAAPEDVLRLARIDKPTAGDGEILVRVRAASVDRGTWHLMAGLPSAMRVATGFRRPKAQNPGRCLAGTVEAIGADVTGFNVGEEVYGTTTASFAEHVVVQPERLALKPTNVSFEQAAAAPISGITALQAVRDAADVSPGQKVLVIGASGGVGTFAVQIAKAFGAEVTGVCSTAKVDLVRSLGADHVIDYTREDFAAGAPGYDVIIDTGGNSRVSHLRRALAPGGRLVLVGGESDGKFLGGFGRQLRAPLTSLFVGPKMKLFGAKENAADLLVLRELIEAGQVTPAVDRTFPPADTAAAVRYLQDGHARGKVVISV